MNKKTFYGACASSLLISLSLSAHAERADREKPIHLEADRMSIDDIKKVKTLEGNVVMIQGTLELRTNRLVVTDDADGFQNGVATGGANGLARFRQKREGVDEWMEGEAERIEHDARSEVTQFFVRAWVQSGADEVRFTATASDPDGDPLAFNWQHFGGGAQIVSPNSNEITRQFTSAGTYIVTCTVSDMKGGTVARNQLITVGSATTFTISGRVTVLGQGLQDVVVTANNANGVITDADGYFTIPALAANTYTLTPLLYGYAFSELFNNSITVGPNFSGAVFEATAQSVVTISALNPNANEAAPVTAGTFRIARTGDTSQDLVVNVNSALGGATITTDYTLTPAYVTGSQGFTTFTIPADADYLDVSVTSVADTASEGPETVILQLGPGNG